MTDTERARAFRFRLLGDDTQEMDDLFDRELADEFAAVREDCAQLLDGLSENAEERSARVYRDAAAAIRELGDG